MGSPHRPKKPHDHVLFFLFSTTHATVSLPWTSAQTPLSTNPIVVFVCFCCHGPLPGNNLTVVQKDVELNVSTSQGFTVLCHIARQSSRDSEFQVTWFQDGRRPIFTAYRNATLQPFEKSGRLRFGRPLRNTFSLTVSTPAPEDAGVYFCEVEEWLPSPSRGWRKVARQRSGYWTVGVHSPGKPL